MLWGFCIHKKKGNWSILTLSPPPSWGRGRGRRDRSEFFFFTFSGVEGAKRTLGKEKNKVRPHVAYTQARFFVSTPFYRYVVVLIPYFFLTLFFFVWFFFWRLTFFFNALWILRWFIFSTRFGRNSLKILVIRRTGLTLGWSKLKMGGWGVLMTWRDKSSRKLTIPSDARTSLHWTDRA